MSLRLTGAQVLTPDGMQDTSVTLDGAVLGDGPGHEVDLSGCLILPGIVDIHGDGFERHMAPRRGALREAEAGVVANAAEMAANGITTGVMAQFWSWEGGMRGPEFAEHVCTTVARVAPTLATDLRLQLRLEYHMVDDFPAVEAFLDRHDIRYLVFNDHLQHDRLAIGARPQRLTGQALKAGRNPEDHFAMMIGLHMNRARVPEALDGLCQKLQARGVVMGSHDDADAETRARWRDLGAGISEFPETLAAAQAARDGGDRIILGAPNVVRGASHKGNVSATDLVARGLCDALASDYHYPAPRAAALRLVETGICDLPTAWRMVSETPARMLGLKDRGRIAPDQRADLVVLDPDTRRVGATFAAGEVTHLSGEVGRRFLRALA